MIPAQNIVAWRNVVPWADPRQIEQDLMICRALIDIFTDEGLRHALRFRGGTALNKLHFPAPLRYSEDIDLVRTSPGPIGPILDRLRAVLEPWLGGAQFDQSPVAPKFRFRVDAEAAAASPSGSRSRSIPARSRLMIRRMGCHCVLIIRGSQAKPRSPPFPRRGAGDETAGALAARQGPRPLRPCLCAGDVQWPRPRSYRHIVRAVSRAFRPVYIPRAVPGAYAREAYIKPLLPAESAERMTEAATADSFRRVFMMLVDRLPGEPWAHLSEIKERFRIAW